MQTPSSIRKDSHVSAQTAWGLLMGDALSVPSELIPPLSNAKLTAAHPKSARTTAAFAGKAWVETLIMCALIVQPFQGE